MTNEMLAAAVASYLTGEPVRTIANRLGVSRPTVYLWLRKAGYHRGQPVCGSEAGYQRHLRLNTPTCDGCRAAHARSQREWRSRPVEVDDAELVAAASTGWVEDQRRVARLICAKAQDREDARNLLEMLGLLPAVGSVPWDASALAS